MKRLLNSFTQKHGLEAFAFACIALAAIRNVASIDTVMDVSGGDEGYYLYNGISNHPVGYKHLYSYFYSLLHWFNSNPIEIYHLSFQLVCATTTILFYFALRLFQITMPIAALSCSTTRCTQTESGI